MPKVKFSNGGGGHPWSAYINGEHLHSPFLHHKSTLVPVFIRKVKTCTDFATLMVSFDKHKHVLVHSKFFTFPFGTSFVIVGMCWEFGA